MSASAFILLTALLTWPGFVLTAGAGPGDAGPVTADASRAVVEIHGRVTHAETGAPLEGAQVEMPGLRLATLTGVDGRYGIEVPAGMRGREVVVRFQHIGYGTEARRVRLDAASVELDVALSPIVVSLQSAEVTVRGGEVQGRVTAALSVRSAEAWRVSASSPVDEVARRWNTESYAYIDENGFLPTVGEPVSTFSIDVDRASYSNVRRFLDSGRLPPVDAVRIEELVNYFPYHDPPPTDGRPFAVPTEVAPAPWQPRHRLLRISLKAPSVEVAELPPANLVFLVDVSGSMKSWNKLPLVRTSLRMLVEQLRPQDRIGLVVYAGAAGVVLESTPGDDKARILEAIEGLEAGGSTAGGAGIRLAYDVARRGHVEGGVNRVILATDGDFNVGVSSDAEMVRLVEEKRDQGTFLTVLGFGTGNLKDSKMEQIADHGNGNFAYIDSSLEARKTLVGEFGGTLLTVAKDVKVQVEFNPARVAAYRLIGYENRLLENRDFENDSVDAGEIGAGHTVTALYEIVPVGADTPEARALPQELRYQRSVTREAAESEELGFVRLRYKPADGDVSTEISTAVADQAGAPSRDFRFATAVAGWGMLLRGSDHAGGFRLDQVIELAEAGIGDDPGGYRADFLRLVHRTVDIGLDRTGPDGPGVR